MRQILLLIACILCFSGVFAEEVKFAKWQSADNENIEGTQVVNNATINLQIKVDGYESGTQFDLIIKEKGQVILNPDDHVAIITVEVNEDGIATGTWTTDFTDKLLKSSPSEDSTNYDKYPDLFFEVNLKGDTEKIGKSGYIEVVNFKSSETLIIKDTLDESPLGDRTPLLLVHGWQFNGMPADYGGDVWYNFGAFYKNDIDNPDDPEKPDLKKLYKPYLIKYHSNFISVEELGDLFREKIEARINDDWEGKSITILSHSMGGLVSRAFMNSSINGIKGGELVTKLITLGTPHHGSPMANGPIRKEVNSSFGLPTLVDLLELQFFETYPLAPNYLQHNRSDMRWDNYDGLFTDHYSSFPDERNEWLENFNSITGYDHKIIAYGSSWDGETHYDLVAYAGYLVLTEIGMANDGIVPLESALYAGHDVVQRTFDPYNHFNIGEGNDNENDELFTKYLKDDLLAAAPKPEEDNIQPTVTLTSGESGSVNSSFVLQIKFSEEVTGFESADISVTNGTVDNLTTTDNIEFTAEITPENEGLVTVNVSESVVTDLDENSNTSAEQFSINYDTTAPTATLASDESGSVNSSFVLQINFSEEVTGFESTDISVTNGTANTPVTTDNIEFTAEITPENDGLVTVILNENVVTDLAGNGNTASEEFSITYTGIEELRERGILIYPVPAKDNLKIVSNKFFGNTRVEIYNLGGTCVYSKKIRSPFTEDINVLGFSPATYLLKMKLKDEVVTSKILIVR